MEKEPNKHTVFPKGAIVGFDFEKMRVLRSTGKTFGPWDTPVCEVESITATQMQRLTDCFHDDLAAGRT